MEASIIPCVEALKSFTFSMHNSCYLLLSQDTAIILKRESERLAAEKETLDRQVERMEQVMQRVTSAQASDSSTDLEELQHVYEDLRSSYPEEYVMYNLPAIALTQVSFKFQVISECCLLLYYNTMAIYPLSMHEQIFKIGCGSIQYQIWPEACTGKCHCLRSHMIVKFNLMQL